MVALNCWVCPAGTPTVDGVTATVPPAATFTVAVPVRVRSITLAATTW
jgi:hypothetical protein